MADPKSTPRIEQVDKTVTNMERWLHILKEALEGLGWLGGIFAMLGLASSRRGSNNTTNGSGTPNRDPQGERSGPKSLMDEFFFLKAMFEKVTDRALTPDEIVVFLTLVKEADLTRLKRQKLFQLIGFEEEIGATPINNTPVSTATNPMGRKIIIGLVSLQRAQAIYLLKDSPLLNNGGDTVVDILKRVGPIVATVQTEITEALHLTAEGDRISQEAYTSDKKQYVTYSRWRWGLVLAIFVATLIVVGVWG